MGAGKPHNEEIHNFVHRILLRWSNQRT